MARTVTATEPPGECESLTGCCLMVAQLETPTVNSHERVYTVKGLVQLFTYPHRNFFTGVMAQALRSASQGTPVLVVQFLKGGINQGHERPVRLGEHLEWIRCNLARCIDTPHLDEVEADSLRSLWQYTQKVVSDGQYSLVVLDELSLAIHFGLIPENEVVAFIEQRPPEVDLILTGPEMPRSLLDLADQVTEVRRSEC